MKQIKSRAFATASLLPMLCLALPAAAQQAAPPSGTTDAATPARGASAGDPQAQPAAQPQANALDDIIITAERRSQDLQKAPLAATGLSAEDLQRKAVTSVESLQFVAPALTVSNFGQGNFFNIRGIGRTESGIQVPSGVATYRDGIPVFAAYFQGEPFYDQGDVAVLRGPQGTFAGQNSTGGAVFINARAPDFDRVNGYVQGNYGNYNDVGLQGAINIPAGDTFAIRAAGDFERRDTFYDFVGNPGGDKGRLMRWSGRLGLRWKPTDGLDINLRVNYNDINYGGYPSKPVPGSGFAGAPFPQDRRPFTIYNNSPIGARDSFGRVSLDVKYTTTSGYVLRSLSGYQFGASVEDLDLDGTNVALWTFHDHVFEHVISQEFNVISPERGPFRWLVGAFYQRDTIHMPVFDLRIPGLGTGKLLLDYRTPKESKAVFGQLTFELSKSLELQVGARYTSYNVSIQANQDTFGGVTYKSEREHDARVTGKVSLNWQVDRDNFVYAFATTGYKNGGINTNVNTPQFRPETVTDFEFGWKSRFANDHIRTQFGAFYELFRNFQLTFPVPLTNGGNFSYFSNASGITKIYGLEGQIQAHLGDFSFDMGGAWVHSALGKFGAIDARFPANGTVDLTGRPKNYSPEFTFNVGAQYDIRLGGDTKLTPRIDYSFIDEQYTTVFRDPLQDRLAPRNLVNAQLTLATGPWRFAAYATNLFDYKYVAATDVSLSYAGAPRQFGLRVTRTF